jgi:hypothetical protein
MRVSFRSKKRRFTLTTGDDDVELETEAEEYVQMIEGSFELSPTQADYEDATYVTGDDDEDYRTRRTPHSFGFASRKNG